MSTCSERNQGYIIAAAFFLVLALSSCCEETIGPAPEVTCSWGMQNIIVDLFDVWGASADDIFAVGAYGFAFHYDGNRWIEMLT